MQDAGSLLVMYFLTRRKMRWIELNLFVGLGAYRVSGLVIVKDRAGSWKFVVLNDGDKCNGGSWTVMADE